MNKKLLVSIYALIIILFLYLFSINKENPNLKLSPEIYDFKEIKWKPSLKLEHNFNIKHAISDKLEVDTIFSECGCTPFLLSSYKFGDSIAFDIKLQFVPTSIGEFQKGIFVYYSGYKFPQELIIKGEVYL